MNTELLEALNILEKEKDISKDTLMDAIENSLINACKNHFGKADNIKVIMDRETCDYKLLQEKTVVEEVEDKVEQISLEDARNIDSKYELGDIVQIRWSPSPSAASRPRTAKPDPAEDPRGGAEGDLRSVL